ncbi:MAG: sensor histidine kinase [Vicinamibacterales bacterium]
MRTLVWRFLAPVLVVLIATGVGALFGKAVAGVVTGTGIAILLAWLLARSAKHRLGFLEQVSRQADAVDIESTAMIDAHDEIDHALRSVAQQAIDERQRRQTERALIEQQAQVLDRMNDGLMRVNVDSRVTYANVAAGSLFGGRNPTGRTFIAVTRDHELNQAARRCLDSGEEQQHTFEIAGEGRLVSAVIVRLGNDPPEALVMLRDITEVSRLQNLRRDFVANVSHELRTPLSTIKILAETLLDVREDDEEAIAYLTKIDAEVDSMTALVRDLLDLTRLETMGSRLALREIDADLLVQDVTDRMRPLASRHRVRLETRVADDARTLVGDERRLHQALINLITNAIVHTPDGGSVTVGVRRGETMVEFVVRDTGHGIPAEHLPRVWERFFKTDKARTGPGTGLGLAIVKHIVQAHSGTVSAVSTLGEGSEFRFAIPDNLGPVQRLPAAVDVPIAPN